MSGISTLQVSSGTLGTPQQLKVNAASSSYRHSLAASVNDGEYARNIFNDVGQTTAHALSFEWTPPIKWAEAEPNKNKIVITFSLLTYDYMNNHIGTNYYNVTYSIPSIPPSATVKIIDETDAYEKVGRYLQNYSSLNFDIAATGQYEAEIASIVTTINGQKYTGENFATGKIRSFGSGDATPKWTYEIVVTDTRGQKTTKSGELQFYYYDRPQLTDIQVYRCTETAKKDNNGAYLGVSYDAIIESLDNLNTAKYTLRYKKTTDGEDAWVTEELTALENAFVLYGATTVFAADTTASYDVELTLEDEFYNGDTATVRAGEGPSVTKLFSWLAKGLGWAFGKVAEIENAVEIAKGWKLIMDGSEVKDFVVDSGFSMDGWQYRLWNSGIAECWWTEYCYISPADMTEWGSVFESTVYGGIPYPADKFEFLSAPQEIKQISGSELGFWLTQHAGHFNTNTESGKWVFVRPTGIGQYCGITVTIYAVGQWKR